MTDLPTSKESLLLKETLSALLDHEAGKRDALELRRLVRSLEENPELLQNYRRYLQAQRALRGEPLLPPVDFLAGVQQRLVEDDLPRAVALPATRPRWQQGALQGALAASIAVLTVWLVQRPAQDPLPMPVATVAPVPQASVPVAESALTRLGDQGDHRLVRSQVLTVAAGANGAVLPQKNAPASNRPDCLVVEGELGASQGLRPLRLPDGYVLCRMEENRQRCHAVSTTVACSIP